MKKIMLSSLVLLPLIVLLILTLGGMVVSKTSYIYVEKWSSRRATSSF